MVAMKRSNSAPTETQRAQKYRIVLPSDVPIPWTELAPAGEGLYRTASALAELAVQTQHDYTTFGGI